MQNSYVNYDFDKNKDFLLNILSTSPGAWLENKRKADNAEGLWRIHDGLYDVTDFINVHPGGKFWLEETKGTDITELFESHHVKSDQPEKMLKHFYICKANSPRLAKYTFNEDGFYRTVKRRVRQVLKTVSKKDEKVSHLYTDLLAVTATTTACLASYFTMYSLAFIAGILSTFSLIASHNYCHMKDNWRMHYADVFGFPHRMVRIIHVLSHHMHTNTPVDMHFIICKPFANFFPVSKNYCVKYLSSLYIPLLAFPLIMYMFQTIRFLEYWFICRIIDKKVLLTFVIPVAVYLSGYKSLYSAFLILQVIIITHGFCFGMISFTSNHIHPDIYIDHDLTRSKNEMDWGIIQLDTIQDRHVVTGSKFWVLVTLGDHALHHLFPTIDHSILNQLYPVVEKTLKEFNINSIRMTSQVDMLLGFFQRLKIEVPNLNRFKLGYVRK